ncbi:hypothetical protein [Ornithinimicrobium sediminis]|uniref:hypothetical protein n=1 Tax=Ornithinimicrobium sediminis TaxID=2904603 RepID=UPI001E579937|nr:hypothetical protein [Ornithinimicrobium sediminis]MCE0486114.1 hypothetical protein [Ornithinimicrobium sediminis]
MELTTLLLDGETAVIDVPDAEELTTPVRTSVLFAAGREVEVNAGTPEAAEHFVTSTGSALTSALTLRGGTTLRTGALGGGSGLVFLVELHPHPVFGPAPPGLSVEDLAALLVGARMTTTAAGPRFDPRGGIEWSPYRTHDAVVPVQVRGGQRYVMDVRRAFTPGRPGEAGSGRRVAGGRLSRSAPEEGRHVILEAPDHVVYGIPLPETDLDVLVGSMSQVQVRRG